jgi:hypothetical protein
VDGVLVGAGSSKPCEIIIQLQPLWCEKTVPTRQFCHMISAGLQQFPNFTVWMAF